MELHCQQMSPGGVEPVHDILRLCGLDMQERLGLSHWVPPYPLEALRRSAQERQVYAVFLEDRIAATFTTGTQIPPYYRKIPTLWERWGLSPTRLLTFYTKLGYVSQGHFFFTLPPFGETEAMCFEKPGQDFAVR